MLVNELRNHMFEDRASSTCLHHGSVFELRYEQMMKWDESSF